MSAATIDRLLRAPKAGTSRKRPRRAVPEIRRRVRVRTFADWNEPPPGSMEMDLVAHCGDVNRGSYLAEVKAACRAGTSLHPLLTGRQLVLRICKEAAGCGSNGRQGIFDPIG